MPLGKAKFLGNKKTSKSKPSVKTHASKAPPRAAPSRPTTTTRKGPAPHPTKRAPAPPPPVQRTYNTQSTPGSGALPPHLQLAPNRTWGEAIYPFTGDMSCDISFQKDDRIEILTKTPFEFDWWEGRFNGKVGIFPANYVRVVA